jgi:ATP-binding cassette subfamily C protein CydCD
MAGPASDSQLLTACAKAGLNFSDTEAFPFSLDTRISTSSGLSTGQRRRIALARVLLRDSKVVILDEPTASVDGETEGLIVEAIEELKAAGKIVIAVAHHPSVIAIADNVVQISEPKLLEIGLSQ